MTRHNERYIVRLIDIMVRATEEDPEMMTNDAVIGTADGIDLLLHPWQTPAVQLSPLIGETGFCALFGRATRLASALFGWLLPMQTEKSIDALLVAMRAVCRRGPG